ncbi:MAG: LysR family transcriptional regulator [Bdellovibrionota bacterium]
MRLLCALDQKKTLSALAVHFHRDKSVLSRKLKHLSEKSRTIEKIGSQWRLTELGKRLSRLSVDFDEAQKKILGQPTKLRIAGSRLFLSFFLAHRIDELQQLFPNREFQLLSQEGSPEASLLNGTADMAFACGRPQDPSVGFKRGLREPYCAVMTVLFHRSHGSPDLAGLFNLPHFALLGPDENMPFLKHLSEKTPIVGCSNDPVVALQSVRHGKSWSILPYYCVQEEVARKEMLVFPLRSQEVPTYGVWWLKSRKGAAETAMRTFHWFSTQRLDAESEKSLA